MVLLLRENCPDIRNSQGDRYLQRTKEYGMDVDVYDPHANKKEVEKEYGIQLIDSLSGKYDAILLAVAHKSILELDFEAIKSGNNTIVFDTKAVLSRDIVTARL